MRDLAQAARLRNGELAPIKAHDSAEGAMKAGNVVEGWQRCGRRATGGRLATLWVGNVVDGWDLRLIKCPETLA